ncbi:hypothetical protein Mpsy_2791 [Methanolobus psychrophilus R15]|nr:hypothetical protein Mpsy_2791 [Methanolobus psychrophilus R15]
MAEEIECPECKDLNVKELADIVDPGYRTKILYQCCECKNVWTV